MTTVPLPPPRRLERTVSLSDDRPGKAEKLGHFSRMAVHLELAPEARNLSLTPGFLRGCSLGPFGTHPDFHCPINSIADLRSWRVSNSRSGDRVHRGQQSESSRAVPLSVSPPTDRARHRICAASPFSLASAEAPCRPHSKRPASDLCVSGGRARARRRSRLTCPQDSVTQVESSGC